MINGCFRVSTPDQRARLAGEARSKGGGGQEESRDKSLINSELRIVLTTGNAAPAEKRGSSDVDARSRANSGDPSFDTRARLHRAAPIVNAVALSWKREEGTSKRKGDGKRKGRALEGGDERASSRGAHVRRPARMASFMHVRRH